MSREPKGGTKNVPRRISDADQGPERIDPRSGLARLREAMRVILRAPKSDRGDRQASNR